MAEEIQEAVQIIRVAYDGIEIAMKVGSGGINAMQKAIDFLKGMLDYEKTLGKTSMRKLLMKGGDLQVLQFETKDMKKVEKMAKKYGILYSVLPDVNKKDGLSEVIFHTEAVPRVNMMIQKLSFGRIATFDDYLKNGDEKQLGRLMDFLKSQKMGNDKVHTAESARASAAMDGLIEKVGLFAMEKQSISVDAVKENFSIDHIQAENVLKQLETIGVLGAKNEAGEHKVIMDKDAFINRIRGYQNLAERMMAVSASKNTNLSDVTISKTLIVQENDHAVKTRVPGTWGENARYVWLKKENIMDIHNGKTMLTFIDNSKDYKLYDEANRVVETKRGDELYGHYDKVESSVREKYEKTQVKEETKTKTVQQTKKSTPTVKKR
ncbi:MAG: PcfB family protein [Lachnospiraceae bacterium]|nr:PcfB family protein [Lachnospiraceae bacterium]